jgi:hypothetical protein
MGSSDTAVAISIVVKDDGSLALIDAAESKLVKLQNVSVGVGDVNKRLASSFGLVDANLGGLNSSLSSTVQSMTGFAGASIAGVDSLNRSLEGAKGNIREVGGLGREMGLNLGYSMKHAIADNEVLMAGLRTLTSLFVGIAAIDIGMQIVEGLEHVYEKWFDVNKEVDAYPQKAAAAADEKLIDTSSLEEATLLLKEANDQVDQLKAKREATGAYQPGGGVMNLLARTAGPGMAGEFAGGVIPPQGTDNSSFFTPGDDKTQAETQEQIDRMAEHKRQSEEKTTQEGLKGQASYDAAVDQGYAKNASHEKDALAEINQRYDSMKAREENLAKIHNDGYNAAKARGESMEGKSLWTEDPNAFNQERAAAVKAAQQEAAGQRVAQARTENEQIISMQNAAVDAGVKGEALFPVAWCPALATWPPGRSPASSTCAWASG